MKNIAILGSTGSIGQQSLDIVLAHPDKLKVIALSAGANNVEKLAKQISTFKPKLVCVPNENTANHLKDLLDKTQQLEIICGESGLIDIAEHNEVDILVTGLVGFLGVLPTAAAIKKGKTIALANKETLVAAGPAIMPMVKEYKASIIPVDSEHSAIHQSIAHHSNKDIEKIWLTASGGPFRKWSREQIEKATIQDALNHPNWSMGKKITIDSATLMNKGLEVIEARWLFDISPKNIRVVIHPQSILHSAVEFIDGSIIGQMGLPSMSLPIHYALFYPERVRASSHIPRLDFVKAASFTFEEPDFERFPCLKLATEVAAEDNTLASVLNAANEIAVDAFLKGHIKFIDIYNLIKQVVDKHSSISKPSLNDIIETNKWARHTCQELTTVLAK